jgi:HD-GYP domain-containing protein (c-di-GMP phosphodiesterase class II)
MSREYASLMDRGGPASVISMAELLATLSLGTDLGLDRATDHVMRQTLVAMRLAEVLGLSDAESDALYYAGLLAWVGCHVDAYEQARWFGDDTAFKADARTMNGGGSLEEMRFMFGHLGAGRPALGRVKIAMSVRGDGWYKAANDMLANHTLATEQLGQGLGLEGDVLAVVFQTFERWDGKGAPDGISGAELLLGARIITLADVVEVYHRAGGVDAAIAVARDRSGSQFDPAGVEAFCPAAGEIFGAIADEPAWNMVMDREPAVAFGLTGAVLERALEAIADFIDLKSPFMLGHSRGVANLAATAASEAGHADEDVTLLRQAGLVHDIGRLGVPNTIWDKPGPLTPPEVERVRLHAYLTERILSFSPVLRPLGAVAALHHERLDGSGYSKGLTGDAIGPTARLLAAADCYHALREPRPHRPARSAEEAAEVVTAEVRAGKLDSHAVDAVLRAAGHTPKRRRTWPAGLTTREVEVLRLLARGFSQREIADELVITRRTAGHHIEHIYTKIGVSNRARASLFAIKHGLVAETLESRPSPVPQP